MKNQMKKNPCDKCICIATCKQKTYTDLVHDCTLVVDYVLNGPIKHPGPRNPKNLKDVFDTLKPVYWRISDKMNDVVVWSAEGKRMYANNLKYCKYC